VQNAEEVTNIYKEAQNLKMLRNKNIVELYHAFLEHKTLILIMEYAGGGTMLEYMETKYPLGECVVRKIFL
jgi:serine/threonine protein kinase